MTDMESYDPIRQKKQNIHLIQETRSIHTMIITFNSEDTLRNYKCLSTYKYEIKN